ncbi:MAG: hypothetical protein WBL20_06580 [Sphingobium sp.]
MSRIEIIRPQHHRYVGLEALEQQRASHCPAGKRPTDQSILLPHCDSCFDERRAVSLTTLKRLHASPEDGGTEHARARLPVQFDQQVGHALVASIGLKSETGRFDLIGRLARLPAPQRVEAANQLSRSHIRHKLLREVEYLIRRLRARQIESLGKGDQIP